MTLFILNLAFIVLSFKEGLKQIRLIHDRNPDTLVCNCNFYTDQIRLALYFRHSYLDFHLIACFTELN